MNHLSPSKTGLAVGKLFAGVHLIWSVLVALGWAQAFVNFSQWAHMVNAPVTVLPFNFSAAVAVVVIAGLAGYFFGFFFAKIWNWLYR
jgi:hypothetical protein